MNQGLDRNMTRRAAIARLGRAGLWAAALGLPTARSLALEPKPEFKFIVVNDTHYTDESCAPYFKGLVRQMKGEGAAFCLHAGDLTEKGEPRRLKEIRNLFSTLNLPFYPVPGNHDYLPPADRRGYSAAFPLRINYSFRHRGWQFIGLDTTEGQKYTGTRIPQATFEMLRDIQGRLDRSRPTVVFTHFPLAGAVQMRPVNADDLLARFDGWDVRAYFSGHFHGFTESVRAGASLTTNRCCALKRNNHDGTREKGYFVCEVAAGKLARRFVEYKFSPAAPVKG